MALNPDEQELYDVAKAALPSWYADDERTNEYLNAIAVMFGKVRALVDNWLKKQIYIGQADGPTATTPDWLGAHALDQNTHRQENETDEALAARLRTPPNAIVRAAIIEAVQAVMDAEGNADPFYVSELPRDQGYIGHYESDTGTGGIFVRGTGNNCTFVANAAYAGPGDSNFNGQPYSSVKPFIYKLVISGADEAGNDGTFTITGVSGDRVQFQNASGVSDVDSGCTWTIEKYDLAGNIVDGFAMCYFGRGYRMGRKRPSIIVILPNGTTESTENAVREMLRQRKAFGVSIVVERRVDPS